MRLSSLVRFLVICFSIVVFPSYLTIEAQSLESPSNSTAQSAASGTTTQSDFSYSIDPMSVSSFGDEQLNETFDKMSSQYSKNSLLFNEIGAAYFERNMYDKAEAAVKRAIILNEQPLFLTNLSVIYEKERRLPDAISAAQQAVTEAPKYVRARNQLCELLILSKRDADAILCYDELAKIEPLDELAQAYYAVALMRSGDADKVISILTPLVSGPQPTALMYNTLGHAFFLKKSFARAAKAFRQGVEFDPDNANIRYNLAIALNAQNDRAGALSQYNVIKRADPSLADQLYRGLNQDKVIYVNEATASKKR